MACLLNAFDLCYATLFAMLVVKQCSWVILFCWLNEMLQHLLFLNLLNTQH